MNIKNRALLFFIYFFVFHLAALSPARPCGTVVWYTAMYIASDESLGGTEDPECKLRALEALACVEPREHRIRERHARELLSMVLDSARGSGGSRLSCAAEIVERLYSPFVDFRSHGAGSKITDSLLKNELIPLGIEKRELFCGDRPRFRPFRKCRE